nr:ribonuclease H-like domain, reverse transcriptase, RNA-dependent DNA polymerase [Tanacetum cinerariifolium]
ILTKFDMESVRTATTPYEAAKSKLKDKSDPPVNVHLYRSMIGSLDLKPNAGLWVQFHEHYDLHRQSEHHMHCEEPSLSSKDQVVITAASCTFFLLTGWFLLVVIIPAG